MKNETSKNMASILNVTDSAYYPCFKWFNNQSLNHSFVINYLSCRSMFRNVVGNMNEALDISLHLKPPKNHFKVLLLNVSPLQKILPFFYFIVEIYFVGYRRSRIFRIETNISTSLPCHMSDILEQQILQHTSQNNSYFEGKS